MRIVADETVVLITGASSGIGPATTLAFALRRARLVLAARNVEALEVAAQECRECRRIGTGRER